MNTLFSENARVETPEELIADATNAAGGQAYSLSAAAALAQYASTGVINSLYDTNAEEKQAKVLELARQTNPEFVAKLAIYARQHGQMRDTPALLVAYLAHDNMDLCKKVFSRVIDSPNMVRKFVSFMRSGTIGRKSLGTASKKLVQNYLNSLTDEQLFKANVGNSPSIPDVIKMMHPKPANNERAALYAYLLGKKPKQGGDKDHLLSLAHEFEAFKKDTSLPVPNVPFEMLTALNLSEDNWKTIARNCSWNQARRSLSTFQRHGVFNDPDMVKLIAARLSNADEVRRSRVLPYQLFITYLNTKEVDQQLRNALQEAVEVSLENIPTIEGDLAIALDVSSSMAWQVVGNRGNASVARNIDVAALATAAILRKNKHATLLPFNTEVVERGVEINPHDSIMTNAAKLAGMCRGGTDCSAPVRWMNKTRTKLDALIMVSDNESWQFYRGKRLPNSPTGMMEEWGIFSERNPSAKLINIDISPSETNQLPQRPDTLLVGGFSNEVFSVVAGYLRGAGEAEYWLKTIDEIKL
jgi:60 kDa SS-A/Ro ribonucleoprotein